MAVFAAREWHRLVRSPAQRQIADHRPRSHVQTAITVFAVACALVALLLCAIFSRRRRWRCWRRALLRRLCLGEDAPRSSAVAWPRACSISAMPSLALVALQALAPQGSKVLFGLFLIVWATDTGALVFGKLIGGKKLAPRCRPARPGLAPSAAA